MSLRGFRKYVFWSVAAVMGLIGIGEFFPSLTAPLFSPGRKDFLVIAHRGASICAPMNTIEAFDKAAELGADGVEFDVMWPGPLVRHPTSKNANPPTLESVLRVLARHGFDRLYLHDKASNGDDPKKALVIAKAIKRHGLEGQTIVMVENGKIGRYDGLGVKVMQNWSGRGWQENRFPLSMATEYVGIYDNIYQTGRWLPLAFHNLPYTISFWPQAKGDYTVFTLNDPHRMRAYLDAGFKAIGTDDVRLLQQVQQGVVWPKKGLCH